MTDLKLLALPLVEVIDLFRLRREANKGAWFITLNFEMVARALRDESYRDLISKADFFIADGLPVAIGAAWIHRRRVSRVPGVDLVEALLKDRGFSRIAMIGGANPRGTLAKLGLADSSRFFIRDSQIDDVRSLVEDADLNSYDPELVLLALGVPKQDHFATALREHMPRALIVGVGGSFDFLAQIKTRAPVWIRALGLEWLHRLCSEPRRLGRRYLIEYPGGLLRAVRYAVRKIINN